MLLSLFQFGRQCQFKRLTGMTVFEEVDILLVVSMRYGCCGSQMTGGLSVLVCVVHQSVQYCCVDNRLKIQYHKQLQENVNFLILLPIIIVVVVIGQEIKNVII